MNIPAHRVAKVIQDLLEFPNATVCRHYVACGLLSLLEEYGVKVTNELAGAIVEADDDTSIPLTKQLIEDLKNENVQVRQPHIGN